MDLLGSGRHAGRRWTEAALGCVPAATCWNATRLAQRLAVLRTAGGDLSDADIDACLTVLNELRMLVFRQSSSG